MKFCQKRLLKNEKRNNSDLIAIVSLSIEVNSKRLASLKILIPSISLGIDVIFLIEMSITFMKSILSFILTLSSFSLIAQDCSELFFSEYIEGSSNNKAVEIYNPTDAPIDLSSYSIERYSNGSDAVSDEMNLSGTINAGGTWIVTNSDTNSTNEFGYIMVELYNMADQWAPVYPSPLYMNGNDAMSLSKNGSIIDIIGKIGEDPGEGGGWTDDATAGFTDANGGAWWTKNHTLVRKASVKSGVKTNPVLFNPASQWDSLSINTWTELGTHECECYSGGPSSIKDKSTSFVLYPNPATNKQNCVDRHTGSVHSKGVRKTVSK